MKIIYVSPSTLPSPTANSVHVLQQCAALADKGQHVWLYCARRRLRSEEVGNDISCYYGIDTTQIKLCTIYYPFRRGATLVIAIFAIASLLRYPFDCIWSRNLFASVILSILWPSKLTIENHTLEDGWRRRLQLWALARPSINIIAISEMLKSDILSQLNNISGVSPIHVMHDASNEQESVKMGVSFSVGHQLESRYRLKKGVPNVLYVGSLYEGRGIELIEEISKAMQEIRFTVVGGTTEQIAAKRLSNKQGNLEFWGYVKHSDIQGILGQADVLLMPYQMAVNPGYSGGNTVRWMSPMKMFEYMLSARPIVASDLPVIREILTSGDNAILVPPDNHYAWRDAINFLIRSPDFASKIGLRAKKLVETKHTWPIRADRFLEIVG